MVVQKSVPAHLTKKLAKHFSPQGHQATADSAIESNLAVPYPGQDSVSEDVRPFTYRAPVRETPDHDAAHPQRRRSDASRKDT